jgi:putative tricarboxylic transport membrane protein
MELFSNLAMGFSTLLSPLNLVVCIVGMTLGTLAGMFLRINAAAAIALALPVTFSLSSVSAIILLISLAFGALHGQAATSFHSGIGAYPDKATPLWLLALGPLLGGCAMAIAIAAFASQTVYLALLFGPAEYAAIQVFILVVAAAFIPGSMFRAIAVILLGLLLSSVGSDLETGAERLTFGIPELSDGIGFLRVVFGVFVVAEIIRGLNPGDVQRGPESPSVAYAAALGFLSGLTGAADRSFVSRTPGEDGPEADQRADGREIGNAVNAGARYFGFTASLLPLLTLGLPLSAATALLVGALTIHGIVPGPQVMTKQPELFWPIFPTIILVCAVAPLVIIPAAFERLPRIGLQLFAPILLVWCCFCIYSVNNATVDVGVVLAFGVLGYLMIRFEIDRGLLVIAFVMGPLLEENIRRSLLVARGDLFVFLNRPISATFLIAAVILLLSVALWRLLYPLRAAASKAQKRA